MAEDGTPRVAGVDGVVVAEPVHVGGGEEVALAVLHAARVGVAVDEVGGGVQEQLRLEGQPLVACRDRHAGAEVAPRAVARDRQAGHVATELVDRLDHVPVGGEAVQIACWERVLGCQPVVDAVDDRPDLRADQARVVVVGVEVTDGEAAAVDEQDGRDRTLEVGPVDPGCPSALGGGEADVLGTEDGGERRGVAQVDREQPEAGPGRLGRPLVEGRCGVDERKDRGDLRVERHRHLHGTDLLTLVPRQATVARRERACAGGVPVGVRARAHGHPRGPAHLRGWTGLGALSWHPRWRPVSATGTVPAR